MGYCVMTESKFVDERLLIILGVKVKKLIKTKSGILYRLQLVEQSHILTH